MKDTVELTKQIWRSEGVRGFFRGSATYIIGGLPSQVGYFVAYKEAKEVADQHFQHVSPGIRYAVCGIIADLAATPVWIPVDIVAQRLQLQRNANMVQYKDASSTRSLVCSHLCTMYRLFIVAPQC